MEREEILVQRAVGGDQEAYGALVEQYKDLVYGLAVSCVGDFWAAQDLAQEALIRGWEKLPQLMDPLKFGPWLRTLTVNLCRMWLRRRRTEAVPLEEMDEGEILPTVGRPRSPLELYEDAEIRAQVMEAVGRLSERNRQALTLYYVDGLSTQEIGDFLGVPKGTVSARLHRARSALKEEMVAMVEDTFVRYRLSEDFAAEVLERLRDGEDQTRIQAAKELDRLAQRLTVGDLLGDLKAGDALVRARAAEALGSIGDAKAAPGLMARLREDPSDGVRAKAAQALGRIGSRDALDMLNEAMEHPISEVRTQAYKAIRKIQAGAEMVRSEVNLRAEDFEAAGVVDALIAALEDEHVAVRVHATNALVGIGAKRAEKALARRLLEDDDATMRAKAAQALGRLDCRTSSSALKQALRDPDALVRSNAGEALGTLRDASALPQLLEAARDWRKRGRFGVGFPAWSIARALVEIGDTSVLPALFPLIKEGSVNTRFALAGVFPQMVSEEDRALAPQLIEALDYRPMRVEALIEALGKIGDPTAVPAILRFMGECPGMDSSSALRVRSAVAWALGRLGPAGMQALRAGLGHEDAQVRETAALGLAFVGDLEDQERLQVVAEGDEDARVRFRARVAMRRIRKRREEGESSE